MKTPNLNSKEIFVSSLDSERPDEQYILYAPFAGIFIPASEEDVVRLENGKEFPDDEELQAVIRLLADKSERELLKIETLQETSELSILLNYICNFSCSYCYSAKGRSKKAIGKDKLLSALSFFIDKKRIDTDNIRLTFSGGGDPLMSPILLKEAIAYSEELANGQQFSISYGIVTNGTLITPGFIDLVKQHDINMVVSFDVLEDVQNRQRGKYSEVCKGINCLIENAIYPGIRSTITPLNVHRMEEMVKEMITKFPALEGIAFEPVLNQSLFPSVAALKDFYDAFAKNYFKASQLGLRHDFYVGNTLVNNTEVCKERACLSKFTLTPEGEITACSRISSSKEDFYEAFHYGTVADNANVRIDTDKLNDIMQRNVYSYPECNACIAKWHCSGGCLLARYGYQPDYFACYCDFVRKMTIGSLMYQQN